MDRGDRRNVPIGERNRCPGVPIVDVQDVGTSRPGELRHRRAEGHEPAIVIPPTLSPAGLHIRMWAGDSGDVDQGDGAEAGERSGAGGTATDPFREVEGFIHLAIERRAVVPPTGVVGHDHVDLDTCLSQREYESAGSLGQPADADEGCQFGAATPEVALNELIAVLDQMTIDRDSLL